MPITFACPCGKLFRVAEEWAGKRVRCKTCGDTIIVPEPDEDPEEPTPAANETPAVHEAEEAKPARGRRQAEEPAIYAMQAEERPSPAGPKRTASEEEEEEESTESDQHEPDRYRGIGTEPAAGGFREWAYLFLLVALVPLFIALLSKGEDSIWPRVQRSVPEMQAEKPTVENLQRVYQYLDSIPANRIEGALLPRKTIMHWVFAFLAAVFFLWLALVVFPTERERVVPILLAGAFTGTVGIALLLLVQFIAFYTQGMVLISRSPIVMVIFWLAWAIGFSYRAALDPSFSFLGSFLGYTFGVGFCEEVCKAMPLIWYYRASGRASWREARAWGFASGVGFGVAEAVMYSGDHYNGFAMPGTYAVRFISCITLHAIWSTAVVLFIHKYQRVVQDQFHWYEWIPRVMFLVAVPMLLHGLYDTALKKDMPALALVVAVVSFGWLAWCIENARKGEEAAVSRA